MAISFGGLASGLDTGTLIDQLVAVENSRATALVKRQQDLSSQKSIISSLSTAVGALGNLAKGMDLASEVQPRKATTSGRRWEKHGVVRTVLLMWRMRLAYWLGADPNDLALRYAAHE